MRYPVGLVTILVLAIASACALSPPAWAESSPAATPSPTPTTSSTPALAATPDPISLEVRTRNVWDIPSTSGPAVGHVLLTNAGEQPANDIHLSGYSPDGTVSIVWGTDPTTTAGQTINVPANEPSQQALSFTWDETDATAGWVVLRPSSGPPVTVPFRVVDAISAQALAGVLVLAAIIAFFIMLGVRPTFTHDERISKNQLSKRATWSFQDSWATNIVALGAFLATVLDASGFLSEVVPGRSTGVFTGFSLLYLSVIAVAGLVYQAMCKDDKPTYRGLMVAGWLVMLAVIGEVATGLILVARGATGQWLALGAFVVVCIILFAYSRTSFKLAQNGSRSTPPAALL